MVRNAVYKGKVLDDDRSIAQSGLEKDAVIILTLKVPAQAGGKAGGGNPTPTEMSARSRAEVRGGVEAPHAGGTNRCSRCNRVLNLVEQNLPCRCRLVFCEAHRPPESHACSYAHAVHGRAQVAGGLMPGEIGAAAAALVTSSYDASHTHPRSRQLHAAGLACLAAGLCSSFGTEWDGVGLPPWVKRMGVAVLLAYLCGSIAHSRYPARGQRGEEPPVFCLWSGSVRTHPWQCLKAEARNAKRVLVEAFQAATAPRARR